MANRNTDQLISDFNDGTNQAADRWTAFLASVKASGQTLTDAQQTEADALIAHLKSVAADPANPVPEIPPPTPGL